MKLILVLLSFLFLFTIICIGNSDSSIIASVKPHTPDSTILSEGKAYKMLYENQIKSNDAILKTIYYALGGLATAIIVVFGSNWWFNDKKVKDILKDNEKQLDDVRKMIHADVIERFNTYSTNITAEINKTHKKQQEEINERISDLTKIFSSFSDKTRLELKEDSKTFQTSYQEQLKLFSETYNQQILSLQKSFDERITNLKDVISSNNKEHERNIERVKSGFEGQIQVIKVDAIEMEAELWMLRGVPLNTLRRYIELASIHLKEGDEFWIRLSLRKINDLLTKLDYILPDSLEDLSGFIDKIPEPFDDLKVSIKTKLDKIPLKQYS